MARHNDGPARAVQTRWVELVVALLIAAIGALVIVDSHRVGIKWGDFGPMPGYFPNFIGWILAVAGLWVAGGTLAQWRKRSDRIFVTLDAVKPVLAVFFPTVVYVAAMPFIGIYVASAVYIGGFMRIQGRYRWPATLAVAVIIPVVLFLLFERWFLVPLPKGPLERMLGF